MATKPNRNAPIDSDRFFAFGLAVLDIRNALNQHHWSRPIYRLRLQNLRDWITAELKRTQEPTNGTHP